MKQILLNPFFLLIIISIAVIYIATIYTIVSRNKKIAIFLGKIFIGTFIFTISGASGVTVMPFKKLNPVNLYNIKTTPPTIIGQIGIYCLFLFILSPWLRYTLSNFLDSCIRIFIKEPFIFLLMIISTLSGFWSETPEITFKASLVLLITTFVAIYMGKQYTWPEIYKFILSLNLIILLYCLAKPSTRADGAWAGILGHKNPFSFFMAQTAVIWLVNAFYYPKQRYLSIVISLLALYGLNRGESGASKVLLIVLIGLWAYLSFIKKLSAQWAFVAVILFMVVSIILGIIIIENLETIVVDGLGKSMTLTGRTEFWPLIIDKINEKPLFGYGVVGFWQPWRAADNPARNIIVASSGFVPPHSHNGFLDLALEVGWVGLGLFTLSFFNNLAKAVKYLTQTKLPEGGLAIFLLVYTLMTNLTEGGLFGVTGIWFWYIVVTARLNSDNPGKIRT